MEGKVGGITNKLRTPTSGIHYANALYCVLVFTTAVKSSFIWLSRQRKEVFSVICMIDDVSDQITL